MKIALIGTLDTKGEEIRYLKGLIERRGHGVLVIDIGLRGPVPFRPDLPREEVMEKAGVELQGLLDRGEEGEAVEAMARGLASVVEELYRQGAIDGVLAVGGGMGAAMVAPALKLLPVGFPKVLVGTSKLVQAGIRPYVGTRDVVVIHAVADLAGMNRLTRKVLRNAAGAICGMVEALEELPREDRPTVAMSMLGTTTSCGLRLKEELEGLGYEVVVFHALGVGGMAMEEFLREEGAGVVVELAVNEIGNHLFGGFASAGPERMEAAGMLGIPQVVTPGNADFINFLSPDTVPERYRNRRIHRHNPQATLVRLEAGQMSLLGRTIAEKLNRSRGAVTVVVPLRGFSSLDREGGPFYDPEADLAFLQALKRELRGPEVREVDLHINDPEFTHLLREVVERIVEKTGPSPGKEVKG